MHDDLKARIVRLEETMSDRLHLRHAGLGHQLRAARGRLPRAILRQGRELAEAKARLANPATAKALNVSRLAATCDLMERALAAVPEGKYRRRFWSARIGMAALNVLAVIALALLFAWWRGVA